MSITIVATSFVSFYIMIGWVYFVHYSVSPRRRMENTEEAQYHMNVQPFCGREITVVVASETGKDLRRCATKEGQLDDLQVMEEVEDDIMGAPVLVYLAHAPLAMHLVQGAAQDQLSCPKMES